MTKTAKITLIVLAALLAAILIAAAICAIYANSGKDKRENVDYLSDWMAALNDSTLLKNVAIPGAHDAGTQGMPWFAATQDKSVTDILKSGTRYLDLRVEQHKEEYYIFHGPSRGQKLEEVLKEIAAFIKAHTQEAIILDFQHFKGDSQSGTAALVEKYLSSYTVKNNSSTVIDADFIDRLTVKNVRGKCLVFWGSDSSEIIQKNYVFKRNNDDGSRTNSALHSFYDSSYNKMSSKKYIEKGLPEYIQSYKDKNKGLFVLQGQLTDGAFVFGPKVRERGHRDNMNKYTEELIYSADLQYINIVMRDFVTAEKNSYILQLNLAKNVVKSTSAEAFAEALGNYIEVTALNMEK